MSAYQYTQNGYLLSTDKTLLQIAIIHRFLADKSYWAKDVPKNIVEKSINGSLCFGIYWKDQQVAFARVISDFATFAYLCDVFVLEEHRGKGLSKWMMEKIMQHPDLQQLRRFTLGTKMHMSYTENLVSENRIMPVTIWKSEWQIFIRK